MLFTMTLKSLLEDSGELIILKVEEEDGEIYLCPIEDEEEFRAVGNIFEDRLIEFYELEKESEEE